MKREKNTSARYLAIQRTIVYDYIPFILLAQYEFESVFHIILYPSKLQKG